MSNQKKTNNLLQLSETDRDINVSMPLKHTDQASQSAQWYQHITDLPLPKFIECDVDGNLSALVKSGFPDQETVYRAWLNIKTEYADAVGTSAHRLYVNLLRDVSILNLTLEAINQIVEILESRFYPQLVTWLNKTLSTTFIFDPKDPVKYKAVLKNALMRSKAIKINIDIKEKQLSVMKAQNEGIGQVPTREYYLGYLITLSNHAKYQLPSDITVFEFCERIKRFVAECDRLKK
jgi:hypothetical protein